MISNKWTSFKVTGDYETSIPVLYAAWSTSQDIEKWFLRTANFYSNDGRKRRRDEPVSAGDTYRWFWHGWGDDVFEDGKILEANGTDLIKFTFTGGCIVSINLKKINEVSVVTLVQENIPEETDPSKNLFVHCQTGWTFYMANLKSVTEGGVDLRNKRLDLSSNFK